MLKIILGVPGIGELCCIVAALLIGYGIVLIVSTYSIVYKEQQEVEKDLKFAKDFGDKAKAADKRNNE